MKFVSILLSFFKTSNMQGDRRYHELFIVKVFCTEERKGWKRRKEIKRRGLMDGNCLEVETGRAARCCQRWLSGSPNRMVVKHYALVADGDDDDGDDDDDDDGDNEGDYLDCPTGWSSNIMMLLLLLLMMMMIRWRWWCWSWWLW